MDLFYNYAELKNLFIDFNNLTDYRIALFDSNFNEITAYPAEISAYCKQLRNDQKLDKECKHCDYISFVKCQNTKKAMIYTCYAGLLEIIVPIMNSNNIIGYLMAGQIRDSSRIWDNLVTKNSAFINFNREDIKNLYESTPSIEEKKITSLKNMLNLCSEHIIKYELIKTNHISSKLDLYIKEHMHEDIDVDSLCEFLKYKKTTFYKITNEIYGMSILQYISLLKMQHAKLLLSSTNLTISEIALQVGYDDYNYFTKKFKKFTGYTPSHFRKNSFWDIHPSQN